MATPDKTNQLIPLDLTLPSTVSQVSINPALLFDETLHYKLCKKHEKERQAKAAANNNGTDGSKGRMGPVVKQIRRVQNMVLVSPLQKKLNFYGVKIKVSFATKRKVTPLDAKK